jgi:hypothetical protein
MASSTVSRTMAWANWYTSAVVGAAASTPAATNSPTGPSSSPAETSAANAITWRSIRWPAKAARSTSSRAGGDRRARRSATTSRTLSGTSVADAGRRTTQPSSTRSTAPELTSRRHSSPTKRALPPLRSVRPAAWPPQLVVELATGHLGDEVLDRRGVQAAESQAAHAVDATQVGETGRKRLGDLVAGVTERADDDQSGRDTVVGDVTQQGEGLRPRPVQIVEHDQRRPTRRRFVQHGDGGVVQTVALGLGVRS